MKDRMVTKLRVRSWDLFFLLGILFLGGCNNLVFEMPQPNGSKDLTEFPEILYGQYIALRPKGKVENINNDTLLLTIEKDRIFQDKIIWKKIPLSEKSEIDNLKAYKETMEGNPTKTKITFSYFEKGDTFYFRKSKIEYFSLKSDYLLRSMDNNYFMNFHDTIHGDEKDYIGWIVFMLTLSDDGILKLNWVNLSDDQDPKQKVRYDSSGKQIFMSTSEAAKYYSSITPVKLLSKEEDIYIVNPDSTQLKKLIANGFFSEFGSYRKLK